MASTSVIDTAPTRRTADTTPVRAERSDGTRKSQQQSFNALLDQRRASDALRNPIDKLSDKPVRAEARKADEQPVESTKKSERKSDKKASGADDDKETRSADKSERRVFKSSDKTESADDVNDVESTDGKADEKTVDAELILGADAVVVDDDALSKGAGKVDAGVVNASPDVDNVTDTLLAAVQGAVAQTTEADVDATEEVASKSASSVADVLSAGKPVVKTAEGEAGAEDAEKPATTAGAIKLGDVPAQAEESAEEGKSFDEIFGAKVSKDLTSTSEKSADTDLPDVLSATNPTTTKVQPAGVQTPVANVPVERQFAEKNVDSIVTSIRGELASKGGTVHLRMDPPTLGTVQIRVDVDANGVLTASMQTSNEQATQLLSHSLSHLKNALESAGVTVDRIQVRQAPSADASSQQNNESQERQQNPHDHPARQEQQRREMLQRMWAKLSLGSDPLDLVA